MRRGALTVWEDAFYPEIVDPMTGAPLPDGEQGELVFTSLSKEAVPIIRYRTGDLSRLRRPSATSRCGAWIASPAATTTCSSSAA